MRGRQIVAVAKSRSPPAPSAGPHPARTTRTSRTKRCHRWKSPSGGTVGAGNHVDTVRRIPWRAPPGEQPERGRREQQRARADRDRGERVGGERKHQDLVMPRAEGQRHMAWRTVRARHDGRQFVVTDVERIECNHFALVTVGTPEREVGRHACASERGRAPRGIQSVETGGVGRGRRRGERIECA